MRMAGDEKSPDRWPSPDAVRRAVERRLPELVHIIGGVRPEAEATLAREKRRRESWEVHRQSTLVEIGPEQLDQTFGVLYDNAVMTADAVRWYRDGDFEGFKRARKGRGAALVHGYTEVPVFLDGRKEDPRQLSVRDDMMRSLQLAQDPETHRTHGKYVLKGIQGPDGKVHTVCGYVEPAQERNDPSTPYHQKMKRFLDEGVVDGGMEYILDRKREYYNRLITHGAYIDIIISEMPMGADIVFENVINDLRAKFPELDDVFFYILGNFEVMPSPRPVRPMPPEWNSRSLNFFQGERDCYIMAENRTHYGPLSVREIEGVTHYLKALWFWLTNKIETLDEKNKSVCRAHIKDLGMIPLLQHLEK